MRYFMPDTSDLTGGNSSSRVPSNMENDPNADEEIIDQTVGDPSSQGQYPRPASGPKIAPDDLADSIAYALDGSGPGPTNDKPNASGHKVITEGTTGEGPDDEEEALRG